MSTWPSKTPAYRRHGAGLEAARGARIAAEVRAPEGVGARWGCSWLPYPPPPQEGAPRTGRGEEQRVE